MCLVDCLWERPGDRKERGGGEGRKEGGENKEIKE